MQTLKAMVFVIITSLVGTLASCGTMGGGMRYLVEPPPAASSSS